MSHMRKRRMKIIVGLDGDRARKDAVEQLQAQRKANLRSGFVFPLDVPTHAAVYPQTCDDCGQTYWSKDQYGSHIGCKGYKPGRTGF